MKVIDIIRTLAAREPALRIEPSRDRRQFWSGWLPPGSPLTPVRKGAYPRSFDYTTGINNQVTPRGEFPVIPSFANLHGFKLITPTLRAACDFRATQLKAVPWTVAPKREFKGKVDPARLATAARLLERPDVTTGWSWEQWVSPVVDEVLTTDALTLIPIRSRGGKVVSFNQRDGQTFKPLVDDTGDRPLPPLPAYQQYIKGSVLAEFTTQELIYRPFRPRSWCTYGDSRVEAIFNVAVLNVLHDSRVAGFFAEGNIPEVAAIMDATVADAMTEEELIKWQEAMDRIAGQTTKQRRVHLFPRFVKDVKPVKDFSWDKALPEWLARIICVELGVPHHLFTSETNRATAKEVNEVIVEMPFRHDLMCFKRLFDELLELAGFGDCEFVWKQPPDFSKESIEGLVMLYQAGVISLQEIRQIQGFDEMALTEQPEGDLDLEQRGDQPQPFTPEEGEAIKKLHPRVSTAALAGRARVSKQRATRDILKPVVAELERQRKAAILKAIEMGKHRGRQIEGAA